jgi:glycosyltransferase involved in cell wall biosynthesis
MEASAVTVAIPYHEERERNGMLDRAIASVEAQTSRPARLLLELDMNREGSAATRNRALNKVATEWVLWLDSDDQLMPNAVQVLLEAQAETGADVVSGAAWIPQRPGHREPVATPPPGWIAPETVTARSSLHVSSLVRTSLARQAGGFAFRQDPGTGMILDDYGFYCALAEAGATFFRVPETVLVWNVHGKNSSGRPTW